jgi:hypothetical protein
VSLMTKTQATRGRATVKARAGAARTQAGATRARVRAQRAAAQAGPRARRAAAQAAPLATSAATTARQGTYSARIWAAPRLHRTGQTLEKRVAPKVAVMMSAAARRIDPAPARRRRWPLVAGGLVLAAGLSGTAAYLLTRRGPVQKQWGKISDTPGTSTAPPEPARDTAASDVNGRVHTP